MDGRRARKLLGVARDASPDELRRAFRARALATHPDQGGSTLAFLEVQTAYDVLRSAPVLQPASVRRPTDSRRTHVRVEQVRVDVYDSTRPRPRRDFADVLRAATARLAS
jgi:hypothetical protein